MHWYRWQDIHKSTNIFVNTISLSQKEYFCVDQKINRYKIVFVSLHIHLHLVHRLEISHFLLRFAHFGFGSPTFIQFFLQFLHINFLWRGRIAQNGIIFTSMLQHVKTKILHLCRLSAFLSLNLYLSLLYPCVYFVQDHWQPSDHQCAWIEIETLGFAPTVNLCEEICHR